jgi:hypothetical protein
MSELASLLLAASDEFVAGSARPLGKWVFVGALALLLVWLILMPRQLIGQAEGAPPWWRNVRVWAIVVCVIQMMVYAYFA